MTEKEFIESSLLEEYALGLLSNVSDIKLTEDFIASSSTVQSEFSLLQQNMEKLAQSKAVIVPKNIKDSLMTRLQGLESQAGKVISLNSKNNHPISGNLLWKVAASVLILISSSIAFYNWQNVKSIEGKNEVLVNGMQKLELLNKRNIDEFRTVQERFALIADPSTKKINLIGNEKAQELNIIAYRNNEDKASYLHIVNIPKAPEGKCYQLWGDVDGEMISLGVLSQKNLDFVSINHLDGATSLNITIENEGGSLHPNVAELVASVGT